MNKMIETLSVIFTIVILSSTGVQGIMNDKLRKKIINSPYLKHLVLILSIYTTKTYEVIKFDNDDNKDMKKNLFKSVLVWILLLLLFKIDFNLILLIIALVIGNKSLNDTNIETNTKKKLITFSRYGIIIVYVYGLSKYFMKSSERNPKSIVDSILKTIN